MKKHFARLLSVIILIPLLLASCNSSPDERAVKDAELKSGVRKDSLLLGFYLGMPKDSVHQRLEYLEKTVDDFMAGDTTFNYTMNVSYKNMEFWGDLEFVNDSLYEVVLNGSVDAIDLMIKNATGIFYNSIIRKYNKAYGDYDIKKSLTDSTDAYSWIDGNREIHISIIGRWIEISYSDWIVKERLEKEELKKINSENVIKDQIRKKVDEI